VSRGKLAFGVVSLHSGFLGMNKDYAAVPWTALDLTSQPGIAKLNADKQTLMASAFSRDNFPDFSNPQYSRELYDRFHATPYWEGQNLGYIPGQESQIPGDLNKIPGEVNKMVNPPASGMPAPDAGASAATPRLIAHTEKPPMAYNPDTVQTIQGRITSVGTKKIPNTTTQGVYLHVKTDAGRTVRVYVGPRPFVDSRGFSFHKGDLVTVTGSFVRHGQHEGVLASQIRRANQTLDLRTPEGRPLWSMDQYRSPSAYGYGSPNQFYDKS